MPSVKVYLASDHAGFALKDDLHSFLTASGYAVEDLGAHERDPNDDYPDYVLPCAKRVAEENSPGAPAHVFGIILGGSGQGEAMAANRISGARAAVFYGEASHAQTDASGASLDLIASARAHNDANLLSLGARFLSAEEARAAAARFLSTPFSLDARHTRRLAKF